MSLVPNVVGGEKQDQGIIIGLMVCQDSCVAPMADTGNHMEAACPGDEGGCRCLYLAVWKKSPGMNLVSDTKRT